MRSVILDTNAYVALGDGEFAELLRLERRRGVYAVADPWTAKELLAGLTKPPSERLGQVWLVYVGWPIARFEPMGIW